MATLGGCAPRMSPWQLRAPVSAFVFRDHVGGQTPVLSDIDALFFCPRTDSTAALTARCRPNCCCTRPLASDRSRTGYEGRQLLTEGGGVPGIQIDFELSAIQAEDNRLIGWTAS
jgi:hypothetical protein